MHPLAAQVIEGNIRAVARAITWIENAHPDKNQLLQDLHPYTGKAYVIGITGSPGAGKSTLVDQLIQFLREQGLSIGIVAVDPTSPFTGGAILGDRVRMQKHATDSQVFIRSMGTRGYLGGLARHSKEAVRVLDAYGCEVILVETVGVGQSELDIMHLADTIALVLSPGTGDKMQAFKAGIMEIADLFVVNKADLAGADRMVAEVSGMIDLVKHDSPWRPPIVKTISVEGTGINQLWDAFQQHKHYLEKSGELVQRRNQHLQNEVEEIVQYEIMHHIRDVLKTPQIHSQLKEVGLGRLNPYSLADQVLKLMQRGSEGDGDET